MSDRAVSLLILARKWALARADVRRLVKARGRLCCEKQWTVKGDPVGDSPAEHPCWKPVYEHTEYGDFGRVVIRGGWAPYEDPDEWCDSCRKRQAIHEQIRPAQNRAAGLAGALQRAALRGD